MSKTSWILFGVVCVALIGGLIFLNKANKIDVGDVNLSKIHQADEASGNIADHVLGNSNSKVVLVEYGDFQCPGCGAADPVIKKVMAKYGDQIAFVFRNYPLSAIHPNALTAAAAAEAAGVLGNYWAMHDKLYENQNAWGNLTGSERTNYFAGLAVEIGLDRDKFIEKIRDENVLKKIDFDKALANKADIQGTPTFYINDEKVSDWKYDSADKTKKTDGKTGDYIWNDAEAFENIAIIPALKKYDIALPE